MTMLPFFMLCSLFYTFLASFIFSIVLVIRYTISLFCGIFSTPVDDTISLYEGTVYHERRHHLSNSFKSSVRYALIDLDRSSYIPPNHLSANEARSIAGTKGPVLLLTIPPSVGYQRSPLNLYYCYDHQECSPNILKNCIAEVSNTQWGEQVRFVFNPNSDLVAKCLHVSPFTDMLGDWEIKTRSPGNNLSVTVSVKHPVLGNYFTAFLTAKRVLSTSKVDYQFFFWLVPQKAAIYTYWQSFKLLSNNVQIFEHPKYQKPGYVEESLSNAKGRGCCMAFPRDSRNNPQPNGRERWYSWTNIAYAVARGCIRKYGPWRGPPTQKVSNTQWGEQVRFVFNPNSDLVAKCLHVSPFMDMLGDWEIKTRSPGNNLSVTVSVKHPVLGNYFTAFLTAKRVLSTSKVDYQFFFWLVPQKAAIYTYWQSFKLLSNNVQIFEHPKYQKPGYVEESLSNAKGRGCCMAFPGDSMNNPQPNGRERWYSWKPMNWPWA